MHDVSNYIQQAFLEYLRGIQTRIKVSSTCYIVISSLTQFQGSQNMLDGSQPQLTFGQLVKLKHHSWE